jgi:RHS repeat-associated protein
MISRGGASVSWSTFNYPLVINQAGGNSSTFSYGPDRQVYRQIAVDAGVTEDRVTIGCGAFEKLVRGSQIEYRHYVEAGGGVVAFVQRNATTAAPTVQTFAEGYYLHDDHLGGTDVVTKSGGVVHVRTSFDAWGQRRDATWNGPPTVGEKSAVGTSTHKGYTGHEQLDNLNLVHMKGRVYDPVIARFVSADPIIQDPYHSQSFNRYSYIWNNPLNATDPTGFAFCEDVGRIKKCSPANNESGSSGVTQNGTGRGSGSLTAPGTQQTGIRSSAQQTNNSPDTEKKAAEEKGKCGVGCGVKKGLHYAREYLIGAADSVIEGQWNAPITTPGGQTLPSIADQYGSYESLFEPAATSEDQLARDLGPTLPILVGVATMRIGGGAPSPRTFSGTAYEIKFIPKHIEGTAAANRQIARDGAAHVFKDRAALATVENALFNGQGGFTGVVRNTERFGLMFDTPIGVRIGANGSRTPLFYGEAKVSANGMYHVIPRTGPSVR